MLRTTMRVMKVAVMMRMITWMLMVTTSNLAVTSSAAFINYQKLQKPLLPMSLQTVSYMNCMRVFQGY